MNKGIILLALIMLGIFTFTSQASDVISHRDIGMDLARDLANEAVVACRKDGYHVSVVVVDRFGNLRAALRDDIASRFTLQIAEEKANAVILAGIPSGQFRDNRGDIRPELNHINGIIMMQGGLPINAGGSRIGAIGVSGAPGGEKDELCAAKALEAVFERLEFAE
jgi:uncharacterized protein GlcG (DUF336 family)